MSTVMLVDDDDALLRTVSKALGRAGHTVIEASNGIEALRAFRQTSVDIVVTDLYMPEKDGLETLCDLRRDFPNVPIITICGNRNAGLMLQAAAGLGAIRTLQKPFDPQVLLRAVTEELKRHSDKGEQQAA